MKPAQFDYYRPTSIEETAALLERFDGDVSVLAGGQSLVPLLNMRMARPGAIVDLGRVPDLDYIEERDGHLAIGAMARQRAVYESELARRTCPLLVEALSLVGHTPIRSRGTVGGSLAHADPAAELPAVLSALGGSVKCVGSDGERVLSAGEFFVTFLTTALMPGEFVTEARFPILPEHSGACFTEVARRHGDFALVGVGAAVTLPEGGDVCSAAHIALNGAGMTPVKPEHVEAALAGRQLDDAAIDAAASDVGAWVEPSNDIHADSEYRKHLATVLTKRALHTARRRASRGEQ